MGCVPTNKSSPTIKVGTTSTEETQTTTSDPENIPAIVDTITGELFCPNSLALYQQWCIPCAAHEYAISTNECLQLVLDPNFYLNLAKPHIASPCPTGTYNSGGLAKDLIGIEHCQAPVQEFQATATATPDTSNQENSQYCETISGAINFPQNKTGGWITGKISCPNNLMAHEFQNDTSQCYYQSSKLGFTSSYPIPCEKFFEEGDAFIRFDPPSSANCNSPSLETMDAQDLAYAPTKFINISSIDKQNCPAIRMFNSNGTRLKCCNYPGPNTKQKSLAPKCETKYFNFTLAYRPSNWQGHALKRIVDCNDRNTYMYPFPHEESDHSTSITCSTFNSSKHTAKIGWFGQEHAGLVISCEDYQNEKPVSVSGKIHCCQRGQMPEQNYNLLQVLSPLSPL